MHLNTIQAGEFKDNFLQISDIPDSYVQSKLKEHFTKKINNWFVLRQKNKNIPIYQSFINEYNIISIGLWKEALNFANSNGIQITYDENFLNAIMDQSLSEEEFTSEVKDMFRDSYDNKGDRFCPFDYQITAAFRLLKYKKSVIEVSTSGGKTLISFIVFKWLYEKGFIRNMVLFVPNITLVKQTTSAFNEYESYIVNQKWKKEWTFETAGGGSTYSAKEKTKEEIPNIIIGTYQTITRFNKKWFSFQDCILGDEIQHITAKSVQKIYSKSVNAKYKFGVSGTVYKKNEFNYFLTQGFIGPLVYSLTSAQLIHKEKRATPVIVVAQELKYSNIDKESLETFYNARLNKPSGDIQISGLIYNRERDYIRNSEDRFKYIIEQIKRTKKNALVLFSDIKGSYGKKIYHTLLEETDKTLFYIDGNTSAGSRKEFLNQFESDESENSIIIASIGVFSEGIDLKRLWNIYLVEPLKSEVILAQILGRGMRRFKDKKAVLLFDFQDNLDWPYKNGPTNKGTISYMSKHAAERNRIYRERKFSIKKEEIIL